jgi:hypothetical protein
MWLGHTRIQIFLLGKHWHTSMSKQKTSGILPNYTKIQIVTPHFLQKGVSENFKFSRDITTSSELRFGSGIYFFLKDLGI